MYIFLSFQEALRPEESCSLSNIVPPSVRIEGCTPPSENNSVDGEMFHYLRFVKFYTFTVKAAFV